MPSPESPAKRMMTRSSCWTCLVTVESLLDAPQPGADKRGSASAAPGSTMNPRGQSLWLHPCYLRHGAAAAAAGAFALVVMDLTVS
jgi:hypothetical protein